jgi:hypothetical protein
MYAPSYYCKFVKTRIELMKSFLILFLCLPLLSAAQLRENRPLPQFTEEPTSVLADSVSGWSLSLDGQWIQGEKLIYPRLISRDEEAYEQNENSLGVDNFEALQLYPVQYGEDTLILLVKLYTRGFYKYEVSKKGWKTETNAYYFLVEKRDLKNALSAIDTSVSMLKMGLLDGGMLVDVNPRKVLKDIVATLRVRERYDRVLVVMAQRVPETKKMRFHLFSLHQVFPDVEGVLKDFTMRGKTMYGSRFLFDFLYYETDEKIFNRFFSLPKSYKLMEAKP